MKSSKRIIQDFAPVANVGFPQNVFTGARYPLLTDLPNTTTLYMWRPGVSSIQTINGGINLTQVGTPRSDIDYMGNTVQNSFTGSQYFSSTDANLGTTGTFSVGMWIYKRDWTRDSTNAGSANYIVSRYNSGGWLLGFGGTFFYTFINGSTLLTAEANYLSAGWHFVVLTRTTSSLKFYIDSELVSVYGANTVSNSGTFGIGADATAASNYLKDNVRLGDCIYHVGTEWTQAQINTLHLAMLPNHTHTQQFAGHDFTLTELNTASNETLALYKANSADILKDETLTYALTNTGTVVNDNGIFGNDNAWRFNGANKLTHPTLLDTVPSNGIVVDFWFKSDSGHPSEAKEIFSKINVPGATYSQMWFEIRTDGTMNFVTYGQSNTGKYIKCSTILPNGGTPWYYVVCAWDAVYGGRVFINAVLENQDTTATTMMANGTQSDFFIGCDYTPSNYFAGCVANFRIRNKVITQSDVDIGYATRYPRLSNNNLNTLSMNVRPSGVAALEYQTNCPVVAQDSTYSYRKGFTMGDGPRAGDSILLKTGY